jgi:TolB-like protein/class 3 adenylate cyclase/Tfp pilus assembly protein PilF
MSTEIKKEIALEIAHVLFIDIVGYSKLSINDQNAAVEELNRVVRGSQQFQKAEAADRLLKIATGDGMALVFYTSPEAPAQCAVEISGAAKDHPRLQLRMGIHSGPVSGVVDVNNRPNLAGAGLNMAQRVMDCGDAGHILLSKHVAEDLAEYEQWRPLLHDLGTCEVKHGVSVAIVNLHADEVGNPQLPKKFQALKKRSVRLRWTVAMTMLLALAAIIAGFVFFLRRPVRPAMADKSIAMLPFENLSRDPDNAYFATGIQDEILTRLAKIGALKVISRNSTQRYAARPGNLSEIARQLGVANILEGSVQKAGDQVHINVQLIRAATDEHLWAESYTRKLENIFGVEGEVATAVAEALKAKLTGAEQHALEQKPTNNPEAYDAYLRGLAYSLRPGYYQADNLNAIKHLGEAVKLDPKFALAWAWLARENALGYFNSIGADSRRLREAAKRASETAIQLQPDLAEAYLAQGYSQYYCDSDYAGAISSFERAGQLSPSNNQVPEALALVCRRLGEWQRSLDYFQQAVQLDPRDAALLSREAETFFMLRQYPAALKADDQMLDVLPDNPAVLADKASIHQAQGNLAAAAALLSPLASHPDQYVLRVQINQLAYERRYAEGIAALQTAAARPDLVPTEYDRIALKTNLAWFQHLAGDAGAACSTCQDVRTTIEALGRNKKETFAYYELAWANVALGDTAKAFTILERDAASVSKDAMATAGVLEQRARVAVQAGEKDLAIQQLAISAQDPIGVNYGDLKLNPIWDPLRGDPRFEKIVASLAPKPTDK